MTADRWFALRGAGLRSHSCARRAGHGWARGRTAHQCICRDRDGADEQVVVGIFRRSVRGWRAAVASMALASSSGQARSRRWWLL